MRTKWFILIFFGLLSFSGISRTGLLDHVISIDIKDTPIKTILRSIEEIGRVKFSYNPQLVNENKKVSLSIRQKSIRYGLNLIFDGSIRFKEIGSHIVLLENESKEAIKARKKINTHFLFKGKIRDKLTGRPINSASIYDVDSRYAVLSDQDGNYTLSIPVSERVRSLYFSKKGYRKIVIVLKIDDPTNIINDVNLIPNENEIEKITPITAQHIPNDNQVKDIDPEPVYEIPQSIEDKALSGVLISEEVFSHSENLEEVNETRIAQISLVPSLGIGSNLSTNGLITNHFSLNVLSGYSKGVEGLEIGGIANIVQKDVLGIQIGGISNVVGATFIGYQVGGIVNLVKEDFWGLQTGGIANVCRSHFNGLQIGGILNTVDGYLYGVEIGGIGNDVNGGFKGLQIGGIVNSIEKDLTGLQIGGIANAIKGGFRGLQLGGISNIAVQDSYGVQLAGIQNVARHSLTGGQISGLLNFAKDGTNFFQISGFMNYANKNFGIQTSGGINYANVNNGLQVGLINISKSGKGVSFGLINFVADGYHKTEVSTNETMHLNLALKSGVKHFYNIYNVGVRFSDDPIYMAGLGFGTCFNTSEKTAVNLDIIGNLTYRFDEESLSQLHKASLNFNYQPAKWITIFAGPTLNVNIINYDQNYNDISYNSIYKEDYFNSQANFWIGGQFGVRL